MKTALLIVDGVLVLGFLLFLPRFSMDWMGGLMASSAVLASAGALAAWKERAAAAPLTVVAAIIALIATVLA